MTSRTSSSPSSGSEVGGGGLEEAAKDGKEVIRGGAEDGPASESVEMGCEGSDGGGLDMLRGYFKTQEVVIQEGNEMG